MDYSRHLVHRLTYNRNFERIGYHSSKAKESTAKPLTHSPIQHGYAVVCLH